MFPPVGAVQLSTTSYAVLGLLAIQPWSAYELTKQARRSLAYCWSRPESVLYAEPKRLVRHGLATVTTERVGRRTRSLYAITEDGRQSLREWLATAPEPPRFELEPVLRLMLADHAGKPDLLQAIEVMRHWAVDRRDAALDQAAQYATTGGPFPERLHVIVLCARLYLDLFDTVERWCDTAVDEIDAWSTTAALGLTPEGAVALRRLNRVAARRRGMSPAGRSTTALSDLDQPS